MPSASAVFVDTNVLVYGEDRSDPIKHQAARNWLGVLWMRRCGRLSTQVLNEFYVVTTHKLKPAMDMGDARAEVRRYQRWQPWVVDHATVETAWSIEARFNVHHWDALMLAAAQQQGCQFMLTEDLQHGQLVDGLRIVNPFLTAPDFLDTSP